MVLIVNHGLTVATTSSDDTLINSGVFVVYFQVKGKIQQQLNGSLFKGPY